MTYSEKTAKQYLEQAYQEITYISPPNKYGFFTYFLTGCVTIYFLLALVNKLLPYQVLLLLFLIFAGYSYLLYNSIKVYKKFETHLKADYEQLCRQRARELIQADIDSLQSTDEADREYLTSLLQELA